MKTPLLAVAAYLFLSFSNSDFEKLKALQGRWAMKTTHGFIVEGWRIVDDSTLEGYSAKVIGRDTLPQESIALTLRKGVITYTPTTLYQNEGKPVDFLLTKIEKGVWVFENPEHDFPTKITYSFPAPSKVKATIGGQTPKGWREVVFDYEKAH